MAFVLAATACGGGGGAGSPGETTSGLSSYSVQQHSATALIRHQDIQYSVRPNPGGRWITSDLRAAADLASPQLSLRMQVTMPPDAGPGSPRPLLVWVHGGGLIAGNKEALQPMAESWARAGYVTAQIDYRLTPALESDASLYQSALQTATEDLTSAIRYLRAQASNYGIDTARVATLGYSAGGEAVLAQAMEPDGLPGTSPDQPGISARVQGAISTGATLVNAFWNSDTLLSYQATDSPVLLMHANPTDPVTRSTWQANVLPTASRINGSGNSCTVYAHLNGEHTADLSFGSAAHPTMDAFLRSRLSLP